MGLRGAWEELLRVREDQDVDIATGAPRWMVISRGIYEFALLVAAVVSAYLIVIEGDTATILSWCIWAWFAADYLVRLYVADDRTRYVREHRLELIAALPLEFFQPFRLLRILRPIGILMRATKGLRDTLGLSGFGLIGSVGIAVVLLGGALLAWVEPETVPTVGDGMWWSLVTTTTVGYGDISPATTTGRVIAGVLMIAGIGLLGAFTAQVADRVMRTAEEAHHRSGDPDIDHVIARLESWTEMSPQDRQRVALLLTTLAGDPAPTSDNGTTAADAVSKAESQVDAGASETTSKGT